MSRYCNLSIYKDYFKSLNNIKDTYRNLKSLKDVKVLLKDYKKNDESSFVANVSRHSTAAYKNNDVSKGNSSKTKVLNPKLSKEVQKMYLNLQKKLSKNKYLWTATGVTAMTELPADTQSNTLTNTENTTSTTNLVTEPIPEPPPPLSQGGEEMVNQLNALGEPTFASLGLGGHSPVGIAQHCFEYLHVELGIEWWAAIALGTLVIRICLFPLVIIAQRNAAKMNNNLPQLQLIQLKMQEAREAGNQLEVARYSQEMMLFMKEKNLNPFKNMIVPLAQMPVFISFFMALREMSNVPVESLRNGGIFWFTDLTVPDQYFLLPLITSATLYATIQAGTDGAKLSSQQGQIMRYVLRALPVIIFPFTLNFPGAILCYWVSSNFISLIQVGFLRIPAVREYFKIEQTQKFDPHNLPIKPKGFKQGLKDAWTNVKLAKELEERTRLDEIAFKRAGKGPIAKTYKFDPTKQVDPRVQNPIQAKKR